MRALLILPMLLIAAPDRPDLTPKQVRTDKEQIQGEWQVIASTWNGGEAYPHITPGSIFVFKGNRMILTLKGNAPTYNYVTILDDTKNPATINFGLDGATPDRNPLPGIFKIEGDVLTLCYQYGSPLARPTQFATTPQSRFVMWQMKRMKK